MPEEEKICGGNSIYSTGYLIIDQFSKGHSVLSNVSEPEANIPRTLSLSVHSLLSVSYVFALHVVKTNECKIIFLGEKVILQLETDRASLWGDIWKAVLFWGDILGRSHRN